MKEEKWGQYQEADATLNLFSVEWRLAAVDGQYKRVREGKQNSFAQPLTNMPN